MADPFRVILCPIQFDDPSLLALGFARRIAEDSGATLHLPHVVPDALPALGEPEVSTTMHSPEEEKAIKELRDIADEHLK
jgi:nucleotide-binding universal stress UspA family protein